MKQFVFGPLLSSLSVGPILLAIVIGVVWTGRPAVGGSIQPFYPVEIESLQAKGLFSSKSVKITGYVLEAESLHKSPGAVLSPACGGLMKVNADGIRNWYRNMAMKLKRLGITSVLIDGFTPRGQKEVCSQKQFGRSIDSETRMMDALAGLRYLRSRTDIDSSAIFLVTWGAAGGLETMRKGLSQAEKSGGRFTASVLFYPRCDQVDVPYSAYAPVQILVGEKDTWNPASACQALLKRLAPDSARVDIEIFADAYHGFDLPRPPSKIDMASGSHLVGANPEARDKAYRQTAAFLSQFHQTSSRQTHSGSGQNEGASAQASLSKEQLISTISGNTLKFRLPRGGHMAWVYFSPDGRAITRIDGQNKKISKQWFINQKAMLCRTFGEDDRQQCTLVRRTDDENKLMLWNKKVRYEAALLNGAVSGE